MPANCTEIKPPVDKDGFDIIFVNGKWNYKEQEKKEETKPEHYEPTTEDKINILDSQYEQNKKILQDYYISFIIAGDEDGMNSIKEELANLTIKYDKTRLSIINGEGDVE